MNQDHLIQHVTEKLNCSQEKAEEFINTALRLFTTLEHKPEDEETIIEVGNITYIIKTEIHCHDFDRSANSSHQIVTTQMISTTTIIQKILTK